MHLRPGRNLQNRPGSGREKEEKSKKLRDWVSWEYNPVKVDCVECREAFALEKEDPPCAECEKPGDLDFENHEIVNIWNRCNNFEREYSSMSGMPKRLKTRDILPVCELYDLTRDDLEKVLVVESIAFQFISQSAQDQMERNRQD